ncbi:CPBP family intramembrane glutamic endopeptidase [Phenylobacterium sp.]|uniref:CPBP family intramembrane glutamic endopeptidase n=1 Tax=Phenylobacterium sp. TaxID=1871053 RepID=UPI0035AEDEBC
MPSPTRSRSRIRPPAGLSAARPASPLAFFLVLAGLAVPLWLASDRFGVIGSLRIPTTDLLLAFAPMAAALLLCAVREGSGVAFALLRRTVDLAVLRRPRWLAATLFLPPAIYLGAALAVRMTGMAEPAPALDLLRLAALLPLFLVLAAGEEVGWMGYAYDPLRARFGAVGAALVLAAPWWAGHLPSMAQIGATRLDVAAWALGAVALRLVMGWLYLGSGSLFAVVLFHALLNLSRIAAFPAAGAHYASAYQVAAAAAAALAALAVLPALLRRGGG